MPGKTFSIEFTYKGSGYFGGVRPFISDHQTMYSVNLETEDHAENLTLILKPSESDLREWDFDCVDGSTPLQNYEMELLKEIGDQVATCLTGRRRINLSATSDSLRL